jgi:hypothetical protein
MLPEERTGPPLVLALSDGHGSAKSFRSEVGSRLAVDVATRELNNLLQGQRSVNRVDAPRGEKQARSLSWFKEMFEGYMPQKIVKGWRSEVLNHWRHNRLTPEQEAIMRGMTKAKNDAQRLYIAYGATLLMALVTEAFILYLQLGDGDILTVSDEGAVTRPIAEDPRLAIGDETTSLATDEPWRQVRMAFHPLVGTRTPPALIVLSTDGYAKSFKSEADFLKVGPDILGMLKSREIGLGYVEDHLKGWLNDASMTGSGDDITVGLIYRLPPPNSSKDKDMDTPAKTIRYLPSQQAARSSGADGENDDPTEAPIGMGPRRRTRPLSREETDREG